MSTAVLERPRLDDDGVGEIETTFDVIDGVCVERRVSIESGGVGANVLFEVKATARHGRLGRVYGADVGFKIFPEPHPLKFPDVSFVATERLSTDILAQTFFPIAPDLAVEVVSPSDIAQDVDTKAAAWIQAGTRLVWVLYPETHRVYIFRAGGQTTVLADGDRLSGDDVLPGFSVDVTSLFTDA